MEVTYPVLFDIFGVVDFLLCVAVVVNGRLLYLLFLFPDRQTILVVVPLEVVILFLVIDS